MPEGLRDQISIRETILTMRKFTPVLFVFILLIAAGSVSAQRQRLLGSKEVDDKLDRDEISVTGWQGDVRRIRFRATQRPIRIYRCEIDFRNGRNQRCNVNALIRAGRYSRWIDLNGDERVIRKVTLWYEARSIGVGKKARIWLYGQD
jgi:hypothetical protein